MNIAFVCKAASNPTTRYRVQPLAEQLEAAGHNVTLLDEISGFGGRMRLLRIVSQADLLFVQRKLFGLPLRWLLLRSKVPLVFDFDDAIFANSDGSPSASRMAAFRAMTSAAKLVFAGNRFLASEAGGLSSEAVELVPTPVATDAYPRRRHEGDLQTLVWIGSRSTARYLEEHREQLEHLGKHMPGLRLLVVADFELALEHLNVENIRWSPESERVALARADVGIAPMSDNTWTRGKCALKVLQYMAAGLPVISSPVGANTEVLVNHETGILATTPDDWLHAAEHLAGADVRATMGAAGYQRLCDEFSQEVILSRMLGALRRAGCLDDAVQ